LIGPADIRENMVRHVASHTEAQLLIIFLQTLGSLLSSVDVFIHRPATEAMTKLNGHGRATMSAKAKKRRFRKVVNCVKLTGLLAILVASTLSVGLLLGNPQVSEGHENTKVDVWSFTVVNCDNGNIRYHQLNGLIGPADIRENMVRHVASHTEAQLLSIHLKISSRVVV
jgi:hypothetical protein